MPDWIHNKHADYVLAAYGVAAAVVIGMAAYALLARRRAMHELKKIGR